MRRTDAQASLPGILEHSFRERQYAIDRYCQANVPKYVGMAEMITPDLGNWRQVWTRAAFAILSAQAPFESAVKALGYATRHIGEADGAVLTAFGMVPAKSEWLNALPTHRETSAMARHAGESWHDYRLRLRADYGGLGLTKASFLACLLYPTQADVACIDTHMQKVYLGHGRFHRLSLTRYLAVESRVRRVAELHGVCTFLAQWMIWDHTRGTVETHAIFPGSHKRPDEPWREW